ncbi:hypothetical protein Pla175_28640 [Pirellulimonas nuda]|uniref:Uncharacterized protein n=1 Tax=Pirellulimonas nuda TaxID=2528009 RepID=A0A518DDB7_9BACT|nr:hypothetical protein [Pirellulimonas nuda]QDU89474.1 hypothetical protein Pla175_28640 [Pirellulimonas nuda]
MLSAAGMWHWFPPLITLRGLLLVASAHGSEIVLNFTLDEHNNNFFKPTDAVGLARRSSLQAAAGYLSTIIAKDDWQSLPDFEETFSLYDMAASSIVDLSSNMMQGTPEADGVGYSDNVRFDNRDSVGEIGYVAYVAAFVLDSDASFLARGGWDSGDRRNPAGVCETELST